MSKIKIEGALMILNMIAICLDVLLSNSNNTNVTQFPLSIINTILDTIAQ